MRSPQHIAIIGGGPSGATLGTLLARQGRNVGIFQPERGDRITVGESLVPAIIPILRNLGVEEEVKSYSQYKPGASFDIKGKASPTFDFDEIPSEFPPYAYNVPRNKFDRTLIENAVEEGVTRFPRRAEVEVSENRKQVVLSEDLPDRVASTFDGQPDLIVDASGRARFLPEELNLSSQTVGDTRGAALFTHFDQMDDVDEGNIHAEVFDRGWAWRIPLQDRVSFGVVTRHNVLDRVGETKEEQIQYFLNNVPRLREVSRDSTRIEPIYRFDNYQLITENLYGENWVLLGDTAGFIDPIFSTGLYLSMGSAETLAERIDSEASRETSFRTYEKSVKEKFDIWQDIVQLFYDGDLLALIKTGADIERTYIGELTNTHVEKHLGRIFTGGAGDSWYSLKLLNFMCSYALRDNDPAEYRVF